MGLADKYADSIHEEQKLYAVWWPNSKVRPGDYGTLEGKRFRRLGHINEAPLYIEPKVQVESAGARYKVELANRETSVTKFGGGVAVTTGYVSAKPGLKIEFMSDFGFYMQLGGAAIRKIDNLAAIKPNLEAAAELAADDPRKWDDRRWVLVTEVVEATNGVVLLSQKRASEIIIEAKGDVPNIDLTNADLTFQIKKDSTATQQFYPESAPLKLTPLMSLAYVDRGLLGLMGGTLKPKRLEGPPPKPVPARLVEFGTMNEDELGPIISGT